MRFEVRALDHHTQCAVGQEDAAQWGEHRVEFRAGARAGAHDDDFLGRVELVVHGQEHL